MHLTPYLVLAQGLRARPNMLIFEVFRQTISLWESKLRSFLTMFGIIWGITSVILLVGLGIGFGIDQPII
jgi:hypothetical protein